MKLHHLHQLVDQLFDKVVAFVARPAVDQSDRNYGQNEGQRSEGLYL